MFILGVALFYNPDEKSRLLSRQRLAEDLYHSPLSDNRMRYSCLVQSMNALYSLTGKIYFYTEADTDEAGVVEMSAQYLSLGSRWCMMRSSSIRSVNWQQTVY